ncbi:hypothetical protein L596_006915 [Steinernema carpocapsae]|uniref:Uncharacterized protein n=1 Tax=Steinernema carpocapsae TaxID=34508 RepID=A0A4U5P7F0_STECR|nr:hypothetical protein L596_006915 [Steinernema carpocapsae]
MVIRHTSISYIIAYCQTAHCKSSFPLQSLSLISFSSPIMTNSSFLLSGDRSLSFQVRPKPVAILPTSSICGKSHGTAFTQSLF